MSLDCNVIASHAILQMHSDNCCPLAHLLGAAKLIRNICSDSIHLYCLHLINSSFIPCTIPQVISSEGIIRYMGYWHFMPDILLNPKLTVVKARTLFLLLACEEYQHIMCNSQAQCLKFQAFLCDMLVEVTQVQSVLCN